MPLQILNSVRLGPLAASASATLVDYLTSIGKASFYARFLAGQGMTANSDGSGGAVADGGAVGLWSTHQSSGFTASFIQATSASRPAYGASRDGKPGIYGNASSWFMTLDSTTALNGPYSVLMAGWVAVEQRYIFSQLSTVHGWLTTANQLDTIRVEGAIATAPQARKATPSGGSSRTKIGWSNSGTAHNNNAPNILRRSSGVDYSSSTIHEIWFVPSLSADEIAQALGYLI